MHYELWYKLRTVQVAVIRCSLLVQHTYVVCITNCGTNYGLCRWRWYDAVCWRWSTWGVTGEDVAVSSSTQVQSSVRPLHGFNTVKSLEKMPSIIIWCVCVCVCVRACVRMYVCSCSCFCPQGWSKYICGLSQRHRLLIMQQTMDERIRILWQRIMLVAVNVSLSRLR